LKNSDRIQTDCAGTWEESIAAAECMNWAAGMPAPSARKKTGESVFNADSPGLVLGLYSENY
jgi:hypothetical protein